MRAKPSRNILLLLPLSYEARQAQVLHQKTPNHLQTLLREIPFFKLYGKSLLMILCVTFLATLEKEAQRGLTEN